MSAESIVPKRPNFILLGSLWGALAGFVLTILGVIGLVAVAFLTTPNINDELAGYFLYVIPVFACGIAFLPMVIGSTIAGLIIGVFYNGRAQRVSGAMATIVGVVIAMIAFILLFGVVYIFLGGSPITEAGNVSVQTNLEIAAWVSPFLVMMILGYSVISHLLNRRLT